MLSRRACLVFTTMRTSRSSCVLPSQKKMDRTPGRDIGARRKPLIHQCPCYLDGLVVGRRCYQDDDLIGHGTLLDNT